MEILSEILEVEEKILWSGRPFEGAIRSEYKVVWIILPLSISMAWALLISIFASVWNKTDDHSWFIFTSLILLFTTSLSIYVIIDTYKKRKIAELHYFITNKRIIIISPILRQFEHDSSEVLYHIGEIDDKFSFIKAKNLLYIDLSSIKKLIFWKSTFGKDYYIFFHFSHEEKDMNRLKFIYIDDIAEIVNVITHKLQFKRIPDKYREIYIKKE